MRFIKRFGVVFTVAAALGMGFPRVHMGVHESGLPRVQWGMHEAQAAAGNEDGYETGFHLGFKETLGTAGAVGLVLGASTLPFYGQPGTHLINLGVGAVAGLLVGSGIWVYQKTGQSGHAGVRTHPILPVPSQSILVPVVSLTW